MAYKNLVDDTSATVSVNTPGVTLDLRYHSTLAREGYGVMVRLRVCAASTVGTDTGAVKLLDENGATLLTVPITGTTEAWYTADGYLPATLAKYDAWYGGNTLGTLTIYAFSLYELHRGVILGAASITLGAITLSATGIARFSKFTVYQSENTGGAAAVHRDNWSFTGDSIHGELMSGVSG